MVIYTSYEPQMKLVFLVHSFSLIFLCYLHFVVLSNLLSNYSTEKNIILCDYKRPSTNLTTSFVQTENPFSRSRGWLELNVIYRHFLLFFSWSALNRLEGIVSSLLREPAEEWNHKFVKVAVLYFCSPSINAHGKYNHFYAPNNIMLYHYDALLTGLPWTVKPKTFVAWYLTVILSGHNATKWFFSLPLPLHSDNKTLLWLLANTAMTLS